jgi:uncharacterized membrane protein YccC
MADSNEVLAERMRHLEKAVTDCETERRADHQDLKEQIVSIHKRMDSVIHDQKINTLNAHVAVVEDKIRDYETVKTNATDASGALKMVVRIVVSVLVMAFMGLIIVKGK